MLSEGLLYAYLEFFFLLIFKKYFKLVLPVLELLMQVMRIFS